MGIGKSGTGMDFTDFLCVFKIFVSLTNLVQEVVAWLAEKKSFTLPKRGFCLVTSIPYNEVGIYSLTMNFLKLSLNLRRLEICLPFFICFLLKNGQLYLGIVP